MTERNRYVERRILAMVDRYPRRLSTADLIELLCKQGNINKQEMLDSLDVLRDDQQLVRTGFGDERGWEAA